MSKKECDTLEEVIQFYNQYLENAFQIDVLDCTKEKLYERELRSLIENSQKRYQAIEDQLKFIQQKQINLKPYVLKLSQDILMDNQF